VDAQLLQPAVDAVVERRLAARLLAAAVCGAPGSEEE